LRAVLEVAARIERATPATRDEVSEAQNIPRRYLATILNDLRRAGLVTASRGPEGGYRLAKTPELISLADVIRAVDGPLTQVGGVRPENLDYPGSAVNLGEVWLKLRAAERELLETTTLREILP
jgi:Rrf2 family protein